MAIQVGDIVGDYQVTGVLGRGGMGKVYRVRSLLTEREEAMKVVLPDLDDDSAFADRFLREIKVHASLQHPNIAALHTALRIGDRLVMILELVDGVSLAEVLLLRGPLDAPLAIHYTVQVLAALAFAHERGVIHRDIKPANILIAGDGVVKLTDFGIARSAGGPRLTGAGVAVGTLAYMSPEQIRSAETDARSDIYSVGLTCYEMLTGHRAFSAENQHELMNAQLSELPPAPTTVNPVVPLALSAAVMRALAKDPTHRFQTAGEFQAALRTPAPAPGVTTATLHTAPALADLEARLSRAIGPIARRLVADAARRYGSISEIRQALASQIADVGQRRTFLETGPTVTAMVTPAAATPAAATPAAATPAPGTSFDPASLDRLAQALAPHIGPIAKMVVQRAARTSRNGYELLNALAGEISNDADRQMFLAAAGGIFPQPG